MTYPRNRDETSGASVVTDAQRDAWRQRFAESDRAIGIETTDVFEPVTQRNEIFSRALWDPAVQSKEVAACFASYWIEAAPRRGEGFTQKDLAEACFGYWASCRAIALSAPGVEQR